MRSLSPLLRQSRRSSILIATILTTAGLLACSKEVSSPAHKEGTEVGKQTAHDASVNKSETVPRSKSEDKAEAAHSLVVEGERFSSRVVRDTQQDGLAVCAYQVPEKWHDDSRVSWRYDYTSNPVSIWRSAENPDNEEAFYAYPAVIYFCLRPDSNYYQPGQNSGGLIFCRPMPPIQTLLAFVRQMRGNMPNLRLVGTKELPELSKILKMKPSPNQKGIGLKITYEFKGKPVEEEFYAVADSVEIPYDGPQGRTWQINWGLSYPHSFRAPTGTLERRRAVFATMVKSVHINPAWEQRRDAIQNYLNEQFNRQLQAGYDAIAAAGRLSRQISANNDAMIASIDKQLQASRSADSRAGEAAKRTSADNFDDYIRGVQTVDDPYWGTSQHSSNEEYHWTDGYGSYRNSNEASYNPNQHENGDWQLMQPSR